MAGSVALGRRAGERQSALAAVRIAGKKEAPGAGARDGRSVAAGRGRSRLQRQVCLGGGHVEVVLAVQDARKHALLRIEELAKVIAAERGAALLDAHQRVRAATRQTGVSYRVEPQLPPDVLGVYVLLPVI